MMRIFSLKVLFAAALAGALLWLTIISMIALRSVNHAIEVSDEIVNDSLEEMHHSMNLQLSITQAAMPVNDHIIHADPAEQGNYRHRNDAVERNFDALLSLPTLLPAQRKIIEEARREWGHAKEMGDAIMQEPNPIGSLVLGNKMEEFDEVLDSTVDSLDRLHMMVVHETKERHEKLHDIKFKTPIFLGIVFFVGLMGIIMSAIVYAYALFPALNKMIHGMHMFSQGHLKHRIDQPKLAELQVLASGFNTMAESVQKVQLELEKQSSRDSLTDCFNRRKFVIDFERETLRAQRSDSAVSILLIDLDHFKTVNDTYGHLIGDKVLKLVAEEMAKQLRVYDTLYRFGGDEFTVLLPEVGEPGARIVASRILEAVSNMQIPVDSDRFISITLSIGIAGFPDDAVSEEKLIELADLATYEAKKAGRNRICHFKDCS